MTSPLRALRRTSPLPDAWALGDVVEDTIDVDGLRLRRAGLCARSPRGEEATGAAAGLGREPIRRSYYELLERAATLEAISRRRDTFVQRSISAQQTGELDGDSVFPVSDRPQQWRFARSNGIALHADWAQACQRAVWELAERDRVLRAWYGEGSVESLPEARLTRLSPSPSYRWRVCRFPAASWMRWSREIEVVGVFGFPIREGAPLVFGYAGRDDRVEALQAAEREALQLLAFLWGEEIPSEEPERLPTPVHHLDRFLWPAQHDVLEGWLDNGHHVFSDGAAAGRQPACDEVTYVDLTPPWLTGGLRTAKALCDAATPLAFGEAPFAAHLPAHLRMHPVA